MKTTTVKAKTRFTCDLCPTGHTVLGLGENPPKGWRYRRQAIHDLHCCPAHSFEDWCVYLEGLGQHRPERDNAKAEAA